MNVQVNRIASKFEELFKDKIDMDDYSGKIGTDEYKKAFLSRCLAAYALVVSSGIDIDMAASCVTDGFNDNGIDAVFNDRNKKQLILVQSKWSYDGNGTISQGDTLKYISGVNKILGMEYESFNPKFLSMKIDIDGAIRSLEYQIKMIVIYTSNSQISEECRSEIDKIIDNTNDELNELLIFENITLSKIYDCLANSSLTQDIILEDVLLNNWGAIEENGIQRGYYGMIDASSIAEWWKQSGNKLLARNIRYYKGNTDVNNGMMKCLSNTPESFCYYNNGIKMIAKKITRKLAHSSDKNTGLFRVEGASIVNGAQTTGCIGKAYEQNQQNVERAKLMIQIISLEGTSAEFGEEITKLSNTQNRIERKTFASMDPFHEKIAKDLLMDNIEYTYKEGGLRTGDNVCSIDEAVVALGCYLGDVSVVTTIKREVGIIFDDISKAPYKLIFNDGVTSFLLWNTIKVSRIFDNYNANFQRDLTGIERLISVHGNRFLLYMVFNEIKRRSIDLRSQNVNLEEELIKDISLHYIYEIKAIRDQLYPEGYIANIFKSASKCKSIFELIESENRFMN